jgi:hypothetical protein
MKHRPKRTAIALVELISVALGARLVTPSRTYQVSEGLSA